MASGVRGAVPKLRSRAQGAAIPLDETDKRLLNALQSRFPLDPRPFETVARKAGMDETEAMDRTAVLLRERIIREITPIFDTTALGYSSMLVAAKVDPEQPQRAARIINEHPGVSHNYLRNHDFNLWFTIATAPDSKLGLDGTLEVLQDLSGAESLRKLPTLTMFKINMNLEMEGGTDKLAAPVEAVEPQPRDPVPIDDLDVLRRVREAVDVPVAAYNVSGEYAALKAAAERGWLDERAVVLETLTAIRRAGADVIVTYHAKEAARWLQG